MTQEMLYLAVSVTNGRDDCIASHTAEARRAGMTGDAYREFLEVVAMANETSRPAQAPRVPVEAAFDMAGRRSGEPD
jgi:AhpD family alkylhydroperoxidase